MLWKTIVAIALAIGAALLTKSTTATLATFFVVMVVVVVIEGVRIVPQQHAWVVERLGKFDRVLEPGFNVIVPFIERIAYKHSLKEVPLDVPEQVCITRDNTQLAVDGIIYFQVVDPKLASYGSSDYIQAITQLAQTALRSVIGKMELDRTFESRDEINHTVVQVLDDAGRSNLLDRGQPVVLEGWTNESAGIARVRYRGASWDARVAGEGSRPEAGATLYIEGQEGSTLVVAAAPPR